MAPVPVQVRLEVPNRQASGLIDKTRARASCHMSWMTPSDRINTLGRKMLTRSALLLRPLCSRPGCCSALAPPPTRTARSGPGVAHINKKPDEKPWRRTARASVPGSAPPLEPADLDRSSPPRLRHTCRLLLVQRRGGEPHQTDGVFMSVPQGCGKTTSSMLWWRRGRRQAVRPLSYDGLYLTHAEQRGREDRQPALGVKGQRRHATSSS